MLQAERVHARLAEPAVGPGRWWSCRPLHPSSRVGALADTAAGRLHPYPAVGAQADSRGPCSGSGHSPPGMPAPTLGMVPAPVRRRSCRPLHRLGCFGARADRQAGCLHPYPAAGAHADIVRSAPVGRQPLSRRPTSRWPGGCRARDGSGIVSISAAGWSSLVARRAHNPKVVGSNPTPATTEALVDRWIGQGFFRCQAVFFRGFHRVLSRLVGAGGSGGGATSCSNTLAASACHPDRWRDVIDASAALPSRKAAATVAGVMDAAVHIPPDDRPALASIGLSHGSGTVRLAALPVLASTVGTDAAIATARRDPSAKVRAWTPRETAGAGRRPSTSGRPDTPGRSGFLVAGSYSPGSVEGVGQAGTRGLKSAKSPSGFRCQIHAWRM
jgi:hypothetical protein